MTDSIDNINQLNVLYGAGQIGKLALFALNKKNIKVDYFCDTHKSKKNKSFYGVKVISPEDLVNIKKVVNIYISNTYMEDVYSYLKKLKFENIYDCEKLFETTDFSGFDINPDPKLDKIFAHKPINVERMIASYKSHKLVYEHEGEKIYISNIDVSITEKCSMMCRDCANLMQYYVSPKNSISSDVIKAIDKLMQSISNLNELRILGGEPFVNKEMYKIVNFASTITNINNIIIYSNATILPKNENLKCLKNKKIKLDITNYGKELSKNHDKMIEILRSNNIAYTTQIVEKWSDRGTVKFRNRTDKENAKVFKNCCVNDYYSLLNGKLYGCPFASHAHNLNLIEKDKTDLIDLLDDKMTNQEIKKELLNFTNRKKVSRFLSACKYCAGGDENVPTVKAAIQTKKPVEYVPYL